MEGEPTAGGDEEGILPIQTKSAFADSILDHLTNLSVRSDIATEKLTAIICTLGPASAQPAVLDEMLEAGMNIARMNFSHGSHEYHANTVKLVREAVARYSRRIGLRWPVAIALDTRGPEIRTGLLEGGASAELELVQGEKIKLTTNDAFAEASNINSVYVDYNNITNVVKPGDRVFVDDGLLSLIVKQIEGNEVHCEIENGGKLGSRKGVNLPGVPVDLPGVSEKDTADLRFGVEQGVDMIFASFIRNAQTVQDVRDVLGEDGKSILIISKIENQQGIDNVDEIIEASDGIMIARGDMGIEIPPQKVFLAQKAIIAKCNRIGKPVACATQMLESMTSHPRATRAESSDVANAILDGADLVMLSGESAKGKFPIVCVRTMAAICREAEAAVWSKQLCTELSFDIAPPTDPMHATALGAVEMARLSKAAMIVVLTVSGRSAHLVARYRPRCPIVTITRYAQVARQANLYRGIIPLIYQAQPKEDWIEDQNDRIDFAIDFGKQRGFVEEGSAVVIVAGWRPGSGYTNTLRLKYILSEVEE
ncbi:pyruvate kinase-like [Schistocerca cancellata]|uniref:pyruvate kinase-like n=1 Tax=Schistocerca cancellata TaxID=274614 RepID=UPI0021188A6C|nr:pyruvate kinase-like [Schistocerca cancellata]